MVRRAAGSLVAAPAAFHLRFSAFAVRSLQCRKFINILRALARPSRLRAGGTAACSAR
jgi:hypothetical protein